MHHAVTRRERGRFFEVSTFPVIGLAEPILLEATGRCPPEDIGGPWGYQKFREALTDPVHERHTELVEWWGNGDYDPEKTNFAELNKAVDDLAAKWPTNHAT